MSSGWHNPVCTIKELSELTGYSQQWWREVLQSSDRPKTIQRGSKPTVLYSDALEWLIDRYGEDGDLRGTARLQPKGLN